MTAPRRLQLRRGNTAAISTYVGAAGELVVNTTTNTLFLHDGSTVGGFATTTNTASITNQISSVNANITLANTGMQGYVNLANTIQSAQLTSANLGIIGYIDLANTIQSAQVGAANLAITAANLGMKGYVDSVASQSIYGNGNVKSYLTQFDGNIVPSANAVYSLGSVTNQWKSLFVSNNTIFVGGVPLSIDATGNLTVNGNVIPTIGYVSAQVANVVVDLSSYALNANVTAANVGIKGYVDLANTIQSNQISAANLGMKGYVDNQITTITGSAPAILDTLGELANALGADANLSVTITSQIANVNANITTANLGMRGYVDSQSFYSNVKVATYLQYGSISNISVAGNVTATYFVGNGALLTGIAASSNYSNIQVATYLPTYDGNIAANISKAGYTWTFGTDGTTTFSGNLVIAGNTSVFGTNGALIQPANDLPLLALSSGANGAVSSIWVEDIGNIGTSNIAAVYANPTVGSKIVRIAVGQNGGPYGPNLWDFGNTGTTRFPNSTILAPAGQNITMQSDQYSQLMWENANLTVAPDMAINSNFYVAQNSAVLDIVYRDGSSTQQQKSWLWSLDGNLKLPSGGYILNSDDSIYGGGNYSNIQVATYLPTYSGVVTASNVAVAGNVTAQYLFGNGSQLTGIIAGSSYSNVQVATYLPTYSGVVTASNVAVAGNVTAIRFFGDGGTLSNVTFNVAGNVTGTSANVTLQAGAYTSVFDNQGNVTVPRLFTAGNIQTAGYLFGNGALLTGIVAGSSYSNVQVETYLPTYAGTVSASLVNTSGNILSSGLSVFGNTRIGLAGVVSGQFHSVVGNITQTSSGGAVYINTTGNVLAAAVVAGAVTSTGTVAVNAATGITTNQATFLLANATATTINMGGAATTINLGSTASATGNVFVGGQIGSNAYNLTLRANGRYNVATSIDSNGGFNSPPYANQAVIGGTGTGMTANYSATGGYLTTLTIYNSGTGYRNGDVISVPGGIAGNSFVLQNYSSGRVGAFTGTALYTFGIDGNLTVPGNVSATTFVGSGALLTSLPGYAYGNVNVAAYLNATGYNLYSNVNVANYLTTATITTTGNVTAGNLITGGALYVANITTTGASGNISGANYITANVILTNGGYGNISQVANIQANAILVSGNVTSTYFLGNGALLTGIVVSGNIGINSITATGNILSTGLSVFGNTRIGSLATPGALHTIIGNVDVTGAGTEYFNIGGNVMAIQASFGSINTTGNVTANYFVGNGTLLTGVATKITGSWTVPTGNSTQSFTVASGTYQLWVDCNIPNGILAWNATATVTNSNVPVVGAQYAWVYDGGGTPIDFTSIPNQFVGTGNTIVRSSVSPSVTTNRFDFGINNTSGGNVTVSYGYVKIS